MRHGRHDVRRLHERKRNVFEWGLPGGILHKRRRNHERRVGIDLRRRLIERRMRRDLVSGVRARNADLHADVQVLPRARLPLTARRGSGRGMVRA
jgi:hypothetical protein